MMAHCRLFADLPGLILRTEERISVTELAKRIGLSKCPAQARLRRLEQDGYILGYGAMLDTIQLGLDNIAFVEVRLSDTREKAIAAFNKAVAGIAEIEEAHMIADNFDYLLKVRTPDMSAYRIVLAEKNFLPSFCREPVDLCGHAIRERNWYERP